MAELLPDPRGNNRARLARQVRNSAADYAKLKADVEPAPVNNGEVEDAPYAASFTKGLLHDAFGLLAEPQDMDNFKIEMSQQVDPDHPSTQFPDTPFPDRPGNFQTGTLQYPPTGWDIYPTGKPARFLVRHPDQVDPAIPDPPPPDAVAHAFEIPNLPSGALVRWRSWESPLAGHTFDLEGPDADGVSIPPAPVLGSPELTAELAELYGMALLRDVSFEAIGTAGSTETGPLSAATPAGVMDALNLLPWFQKNTAIPGLDARAARRRRARFQKNDPTLTAETLFRGSVAGAEFGPYISQFLLIGSAPRARQPEPVDPQRAFSQQAVPFPEIAARRQGGGAPGAAPLAAQCSQDDVAQGLIQYGLQRVPQFFTPHAPGLDYMTDWATWLDVQNGADRRNLDAYADAEFPSGRFIHTPRDLATWVHFDALYQAYLNACLLLIGFKAPTDRGLPEGSGHPTRAGFATFGDPHILSLVTEVATRALKAVRRSKYLIHLRVRPEALAMIAALSGDAANSGKLGGQEGDARTLLDDLPAAIKTWVAEHNAKNNDDNTFTDARLGAGQGAVAKTKHDGSWIGGTAGGNIFLPQTFPEGSPMHPSYGAGHATVAGACVTVLKAWFEMYNLDAVAGLDFKRGQTNLSATLALFNDNNDFKKLFPDEVKMTAIGGTDQPIKGTYRTFDEGRCLRREPDEGLTVQGELNKLAANIAIGRNMAGVHYYSDYYESLRLGERVAVGILHEQMLTYREPVSMRFRSFDNDYILLTGNGGSVGLDDAFIRVRNASGNKIDWSQWWRRAADEAAVS